jgi:phage shock protein A
MMHLAVRVRELVSSNVEALIDKASNPAKMLGLLLTEVEENLIGLHGDLTRAQREHARLAQKAERVAADAEDWTAKAKTAVDHGREDLARAALLARESERRTADELAAEAEAMKTKLAEIETAIAELEAKRADVSARLAQVTPAPTKPGPDGRTARRMDRIDAIERRVGFVSESAGAAASLDGIDAEIAALGKDAAIAAELEAMKAQAKKTPRKKAK